MWYYDTRNSLSLDDSRARYQVWWRSVVAVILFGLATAANAAPVPLTGWEFAALNADASIGEAPIEGWQPVEVPATLANHGIIYIQYGIYRVPIEADQLRNLREPTVLLGSILEADRSYFNGELIGAHGRFGPGIEAITAHRKQRLYRIPESLIRSNDNVLTVQIRVWNTFGGILGPTPVLGEYQELAEIAYQSEYWGSMIDTAMIMLSGSAFLVSLWLLLSTGRRNTELVWLSIIMFSLFTSTSNESLMAYNLGLKNTPLQLLVFMLANILVIPIAHYYRHLQLSIHTSWRGWRDATIVFAGVIYTLSTVELVPSVVGLTAGSLWLIGIISILFELFFGSLRAAQYKVDGALLHFFALLSLVIFSVLLYSIIPVNISLYRPDQIGIALFIILIMLGYLKRNSALHIRHRELTSRVFALRNDEQQRIARDLHDGFGQQLATLKLQLNMLSDTMDQDLVTQANQSLGHGLKQLREITHGLNPVSVSQHGLVWAIENEVASLTGLHQMDINLELQKTDLDSDTKLHLFRIFQECLNNAIKHSNADQIDVNLQQRTRSVVMEIRDNGIGYEAESLRNARGGLGLINLRERAELIGARLSINSSRSHGTRIQVNIQLS